MEFQLKCITGIFTVFIVIVIIIRISIYMEDDYENDEDDEIIIEDIEDRTPELSDSESESSIEVI